MPSGRGWLSQLVVILFGTSEYKPFASSSKPLPTSSKFCIGCDFEFAKTYRVWKIRLVSTRCFFSVRTDLQSVRGGQL